MKQPQSIKLWRSSKRRDKNSNRRKQSNTVLTYSRGHDFIKSKRERERESDPQCHPRQCHGTLRGTPRLRFIMMKGLKIKSAEGNIYTHRNAKQTKTGIGF